MSQAAEEASQPAHQFAGMKDQVGAAWLSITVKVPVQAKAKLGQLVMVLESGCQQELDDGIYKLHQTCIVLFSHNTNTPSHPVNYYYL